MTEPLRYLFKQYGIDSSIIKTLVVGEKYVAVVLQNGNIGVCATLDLKINVCIDDFKAIDIDNIAHRIITQAYFNAVFNYQNDYTNQMDIFDLIDFKDYTTIVMIGFFRSLAEKFRKENIELHIFDKAVSDARLIDMKHQLDYVRKADVVILSSTSIFNGSFTKIIEASNANVFLLGPSSIMHKDIFAYSNIKSVFGSLFEKEDIRVLESIKAGRGTKGFLDYMNKVCF
jgi:uncharacterized protein (DUF4213/DUF364 family)